ncbi:MAG: hybrid sensor histidine kinase/response regulator, partial [Spirochaetota bacterium]
MKKYFNKQFISNMSHELRSPLNSILSLSRVLSLQASDRLDSDEKEYLEIIERNGARLLQLINDLVEVAQIETGIMDINPASLSAGSIVEDVCDRFEEAVLAKGLSLHRDIQKDLPRVTTDESRLYQVLTNLVDNAVKYTEHGSITIRVYKEDERILITVTDTGIGINQQQKSRLFEGYHQGDGTLAGKYPGTGLGLTIVSRSAALIHASLSIESNEGEGSSFTVSMPVKWPGEVSLPADDSAPVPLPAVAGGDDEKTILVVDDDPDNMTILRALLGREYHVVFTYEGKEGITL